MTAGTTETITVGTAIFAASLAMAIRDAQRVGDLDEAAVCFARAQRQGSVVLRIVTELADTSALEADPSP